MAITPHGTPPRRHSIYKFKTPTILVLFKV